ncbi:MAG: hypothetical protein FJ295_15295 [Planctomycetes bacterium]|nr:hypothetical protein [Planctomycetota bacterium]
MAGDASTIGDGKAGSGIWERSEEWLERASEYLNPLLVKEARQALKSNQFASTFILLMTLAWGWSFLGVSLSEFQLTLGPDGRSMLFGYFMILVVAMFVIVPFSAFRSLAAEREDGTFELISITTLSARQIVFGKLGSAVVQMAVYLSALAPCIAFTSLLQGVDIYLISFLLVITSTISLIFSSFGLMFATITRARHWQSALSVLLILGLGFATLIWLLTALNLFISGSGFFGGGVLEYEVFWTSVLNTVTVGFSFIALFVFAAAGQLSFASDNRATALRCVMAVQNVIGLGWFIYYWLATADWDVLCAGVVTLGLYWSVAGAFMTAESPQLSPRVLRQLPQSLLGRAFFSWFNPGSGTGYSFAMANMGVAVVFVFAMLGVSSVLGMREFGLPPFPSGGADHLVITCVMVWAYLAAYLGIGRLILALFRQFIYVSLPLAFVVYCALHVVGNIVPYMLWVGADRYSYSTILAPSWIFTVYDAIDGKLSGDLAVVLVSMSGAVLFLVNFILAAPEVGYEKMAVPDRVLKDEIELHPELQPRAAGSPWD